MKWESASFAKFMSSIWSNLSCSATAQSSVRNFIPGTFLGKTFAYVNPVQTNARGLKLNLHSREACTDFVLIPFQNTTVKKKKVDVKNILECPMQKAQVKEYDVAWSQGQEHANVSVGCIWEHLFFVAINGSMTANVTRCEVIFLLATVCFNVTCKFGFHPLVNANFWCWKIRNWQLWINRKLSRREINVFVLDFCFRDVFESSYLSDWTRQKRQVDLCKLDWRLKEHDWG